MLSGSIVAIATPMVEGGELDLHALRKLIDFHAANGTAGIVIVGTTGESPTVDVDEHCHLIASAVEFAAGRIPVIAGTGANSTAEAVALTAFAKKAGASCSLSVVPYYNKPTQEGLYRHYRTIAEAVDLPMLMYNVPSRTVADLANETALRLAQVPGIVGLKEAHGTIERIKQLLALKLKKFTLLSGDDATACESILLGCHGDISVTANIAPRLMHELCVAALAGNVRRAMDIQFQLMPVHKHLFVEANPMPLKWAMARLGLCGPTMRLPLTPIAAANEAVVEAALRASGLL